MNLKSNIVLIGIVGKAGSGKSTLANTLNKILPSSVIPFTQPLKDFARQLGWNGVKDDKGRRLLQLLGTDVGRKCIDEDLWINKWCNLIESDCESVDTDYYIIADDVRFRNELNCIHNFKGIIIRVIRQNHNLLSGTEHVSETEQDSFLPDSIDLEISNNGTIEELERLGILVAKSLELGRSYGSF